MKVLKEIILCSLLVVSVNCFSQMIHKDSISIIGDQNQSLKKIKFGEYTLNFKDQNLAELYTQDTSFFFVAGLNRYTVKNRHGFEYTIGFEASQVVINSKGRDSVYRFKYLESSETNRSTGISVWHGILDSSIIGITYEDGLMYSFMFFDYSFGAISFWLEEGENGQHKIGHFGLSSIGSDYGSRSKKDMYPGIKVSFNSSATEISNIEFYDQTELVIFELLNRKRSMENIELNEMRLKKRMTKHTGVYQYNTFLIWADDGKPIKGKEHIILE